MAQERLEIPEVEGKTIRHLAVNDDPEYGREVNLQFTDGTELSLWVGVLQRVSAQFLDSGSGRVLFEREDRAAPPPEIRL